MPLLICLILCVALCSAQLETPLSTRAIAAVQDRCAAALQSPGSMSDVLACMKYTGKSVGCADLGVIHGLTKYEDVVYAQLVCQEAKCDCGEAIATKAKAALSTGAAGLEENAAHVKAYLSAAAGGLTKATGSALEVANSVYGGDGVVSDPALYQLLTAASDKLTIKPKHLALSFQVFLGAAQGSDLAAAVASILALQALETTKFFPVYIGLKERVFQAGTKVQLEFTTTTALDNTVSVDKVEVKSVKSEKGAQLPYSNSMDLSPGRYIAEVSVSLKERSKAVSSTQAFVVLGTAAVEDVRALISTDHAIDSGSIPHGTFMSEEGRAGDDHVVHVAFKVASVGMDEPTQTTLRFTHVDSGAAVFVPAKASGGVYKATVSLAEKAKTFKHASGSYAVSILVGDAAFAVPLEVNVGNVELVFTAPAKVIEPLYAKSLLDESDRTLEPLPEIQHRMREPPRRANAIVSFVFACVPMVAVLAFIGAALYIKTKYGSTSASGISGVGLAFIGCCVAVLALTTSFWLGFAITPFYGTVKYLCVLGPITAFVGVKLAGSR